MNGRTVEAGRVTVPVAAGERRIINVNGTTYAVRSTPAGRVYIVRVSK